jgi:hypothetical protein
MSIKILMVMIMKNTTLWDNGCIMMRNVMLLSSGSKSKLRKQTSK